jgi:hypothetical protein
LKIIRGFGKGAVLPMRGGPASGYPESKTREDGKISADGWILNILANIIKSSLRYGDFGL